VKFALVPFSQGAGKMLVKKLTMFLFLYLLGEVTTAMYADSGNSCKY